MSSDEHPSPLCRCKIQEAAAVLFRILWSPPTPPPLLLPRVCVDDFKLYLFFFSLSICTFKELLQEYLKGQEHLHSGVVSKAPQKKILRIRDNNLGKSKSFKCIYISLVVTQIQIP